MQINIDKMAVNYWGIKSNLHYKKHFYNTTYLQIKI